MWREGHAPVSIIGDVLSTLLTARRCLSLQLYWFWLCPERLFHVSQCLERSEGTTYADGDVFSVVLEGQKTQEHPKAPLFPAVCFVLTPGLWTNRNYH